MYRTAHHVTHYNTAQSRTYGQIFICIFNDAVQMQSIELYCSFYGFFHFSLFFLWLQWATLFFLPSFLPYFPLYFPISSPLLLLSFYFLIHTLFFLLFIFLLFSSFLHPLLTSPLGPCLYLFFLPSLPSLTHYTQLYSYLSLLISFFFFCRLIPFNSSSSQIMLLILQIQY